MGFINILNIYWQADCGGGRTNEHFVFSSENTFSDKFACSMNPTRFFFFAILILNIKIFKNKLPVVFVVGFVNCVKLQSHYLKVDR